MDEAVQKAKEDSDLDSFDFDEMDRLLAAFFEICRECSKCDGSSQLVHALLDKEWINPFELSILQSIELRKEEVGQEIAREERKSKIPSMVKAEGNLRKPDPSLWGKKR
ncbi:MAG: hypothetical protein P4L58_00350 [Candidatus Pacebacteria bacterium]|nr:hypothetical protein [Candidatus Paceibacterota bacterium]